MEFLSAREDKRKKETQLEQLQLRKAELLTQLESLVNENEKV